MQNPQAGTRLLCLLSAPFPVFSPLPMVNPESGETVMIPYQEPDGTYVHVSLELNAGGESYFETASEYSDGTWTCDEDSVIRITLEDGRNYYASAWTMGGESYIWLLLELEECMVWLLDGRLMV